MTNQQIAGRKYYLTHRRSRINYTRKWIEEHKEQYDEYQKKYKAQHKEKLKRYKKQWNRNSYRDNIIAPRVIEDLVYRLLQGERFDVVADRLQRQLKEK